MALLDFSILNTVRGIDPERSAAEMAQRVSDALGAGVNAWKTDKARKILEDYRKWSGETEADRFDMDAEIAKRMGGFDASKDAEDRYQAAFANYQQGAPVVPEGGDTAARDAYLAAWDEQATRAILAKQAQAEHDRRLAEAKRGAQEAFDALYPDAASWDEYRAARERWNPYVGEGKNRRAKYDDEKLYEAADAIRWYRPDIASELDARAKNAFDRRTQLEMYQAKMFNPLSRMERAQSAFNSAAVRLREAEARLASDRTNPMFKQQYETALSTFNMAQDALNEAQNAYFGAEGRAPAGEPGEAANLATGQLALVEEMAQELDKFGSLDELMAEAAKRGLNKKGRDELRTIWTQRVGERQREAQLAQGQRRLDQADRDFALKETQYTEGKRGTGIGGQYSDANVQTARNIAAALKNGGDVKPYADDLKKLGFTVEVNPVTGSLLIIRGTKKYSANSADEIVSWIENTYLPAAEAARASAPAAPAKPGNGNGGAPAKPGSGRSRFGKR